MKQRTKEQGFAHIGIIITVLAVIAAVAFGGWYVWQRNEKEKTGNNTNASQSDNSKASRESQEKKDLGSKVFNCKDILRVNYPDTFLAITTDTGQCLVSNVSIDKMPAVGPLPPEQLGLFFNIQSTESTTSKAYMDDFIDKSQQDYPLQLKSQREIQLDNGNMATLSEIYGGHPVEHDFYFFIYIKGNVAITTSYPLNSNHTERALGILQSIQ